MAVMSIGPCAQASCTVTSPTWIEPSTFNTVVGVIRPFSSAAAKVTTLFTEPGSIASVTARLPVSFGRLARFVAGHRGDLGVRDLHDHHAAGVRLRELSTALVSICSAVYCRSESMVRLMSMPVDGRRPRPGRCPG